MRVRCVFSVGCPALLADCTTRDHDGPGRGVNALGPMLLP
jgi:hypothetical protein